MDRLGKLEAEMKKVNERNRRVECDKAWETSYSRRGLITVFTYAAIALYLNAINVPNAYLSAIVPTAGFLLSTMTFPYFKSLWLRSVYTKRK